MLSEAIHLLSAVILSEAKDLLLLYQQSFVAALLRMTGEAMRSSG
jgi:hypothetical protein